MLTAEELKQMLWHSYTDSELQDISSAMLDCLKNPLTQYHKWMFRGLNDEEILQWLRKVKSLRTSQVYEQFCTIAQQELSQEQWKILQWNLAESEAVVL